MQAEEKQDMSNNHIKQPIFSAQTATPCLLCVDGNSILNRTFYGIRPLTTRTGIPTNALYGFVNILSRQLANTGSPLTRSVRLTARRPRSATKLTKHTKRDDMRRRRNC